MIKKLFILTFLLTAAFILHAQSNAQRPKTLQSALKQIEQLQKEKDSLSFALDSLKTVVRAHEQARQKAWVNECAANIEPVSLFMKSHRDVDVYDCELEYGTKNTTSFLQKQYLTVRLFNAERKVVFKYTSESALINLLNWWPAWARKANIINERKTFKDMDRIMIVNDDLEMQFLN